MPLLAPEHVAMLLLTAALAVIAGWAPRARGGGWVVTASRGLALLIVAAYVIETAASVERGLWSPDRSLPLHLTDAATVVAALALWSARPMLVELTYFWGLTASLQAVLTPQLSRGFPDLFFFTFFMTHAGVVVAAVLLVVGRRLVPRRGAVWRAYLMTLVVAAAAAIGTVATGGNYMFLREKPARGSLLDVLGPWPVYIVTAAVLAVLLFLLLDAPFARRRARARDRPCED